MTNRSDDTLPQDQAAAWSAARLRQPVFTVAEAQILTGRPAVGDDTVLAVSAVDAGLVTAAQVDAYQRALHQGLLYRPLPISASEVLRVQQTAGQATGLPWGLHTPIGPRWRITIDAAAVTVDAEQPAGAPPLPPVTVWPPGPHTDQLLTHAAAVHEWWPCLRWADTLTGAARALGRATEPDLATLTEPDQLAVIVLVAAAIRRAVRRIWLARPSTMTSDAVESGVVELIPIRDQLTGPAVAATLAVGPPAGLGDAAWIRLTGADPTHQDRLVTLARAVIEDWIDRAAQDLADMIVSGHRVDIDTHFLASAPAWATRRPAHGVFLTTPPTPRGSTTDGPHGAEAMRQAPGAG
ncbi:hypothetical protein [Micromonospora sp. WMMD1082]|uniref:hypothetical protein n=1 Tax=Micromonospora sp. WMMD1082 TaxID=3016104 RepID=UPI002417E796|nr:hypothetical protein [Micromonospora sp. WMMD1082]MDG4795221.1 hypothetical protein [Micromonospora sp. WMMD1082]